MSMLRAIRDCGFLGTVMALLGVARPLLQRLDPRRFFVRRPASRTKRPRQECQWLRPTSRW